MKNCLRILMLSLVAFSCMKGKKVDTIIFNAKVFTLDDSGKMAQAIAIKDGKIIEVGPDRQIQNKYRADEFIDAKGKDLYPGFTDGHGHLLLLMQARLSADLVGSASMDELLVRVDKFASKTKHKVVVGRGWDQHVWGDSVFPTNKRLNELFPNRPVVLFRIDAHAALLNDAALKMANITKDTKVDGGEVILENGEMTGVLVDHAMDPIFAFLPKYSFEEKKNAFEEIQQELFVYGITGVHEAGMNRDELEFFQRLAKSNALKINLYGMLWPTKENFDFAKKEGIYQLNQLSVRSFKVIGDGALGSRGACLKNHYSDAATYGALTTSLDRFKEISDLCLEVNYQMNTHAIGDSTNSIIIDLLTNINAIKQGHRWRIEHAQVMSKSDLEKISNTGAFLSVQPLHAVSDYKWAINKLGLERLQHAYRYKSLLQAAGMLVIGTDFPVEDFNPFKTIHAAVQRKNMDSEPANGFQLEEALSLEETIKGMTIWAAYGAFQEHELGSIEIGKLATFTIFESKVKSMSVFNENYAYMTFIKGKKVYSAE